MAAVSMDGYIELLGKSGLMSGEEIESSRNEFVKETGEDANAADFAKYLERKNLVTSWHNQKLLDKKYKGFFIGSYKFLQKIGAGGMGKVYLAEHTALARRCAIKVLPRSRMSDTSHLDRFRLEARALAQLDHKNIVRVYDVGEERDLPYIVMEYVEGQDLEGVVGEQGPQSAVRAAHFIGQAAAGLSHAHSRNMIHRDVKPSNLLLDKSNTIKVLDLGLARLTDEDASLTQQYSDQTLGTTDYIAPEQAMDCHSADQRSDVYSLGCTLYYLLTGHPPFNEGNVASRLLAHQQKEPPSIREERISAGVGPVDADLIAICTGMMKKDPQERFQSAREVFDAVADWLKSRRTNVKSSQSHISAVRALQASEAATATQAVTSAVGIVEGGTGDSVDPLFSDNWMAGDTNASQAAMPTVVNGPASIPSDIYSQSSIYSSSSVPTTGLQSPLLQNARRKPRSIFQQYLWAWLGGGGVLSLLLVGGMVMIFAGGDSRESDSGGDNTVAGDPGAAPDAAVAQSKAKRNDSDKKGRAASRPAKGLAVAGKLLVALDADHMRPADSQWQNQGELSGEFSIQEGRDIKLVKVGHKKRVQAVSLDSDFYVGPVAPLELTSGSSCSIEAWVYNAELDERETIVSWGRMQTRGESTFGTAVALSYSADEWRSAVEHGSNMNLPWYPKKDVAEGQPNAPKPDVWHHLAYVYESKDQSTGAGQVRVFVDGKRTNGRAVELNIVAGTKILLGAAPAQMTQKAIATPRRAKLAIGLLRVHSDVLTDKQIVKNYKAEAARFGLAGE